MTPLVAALFAILIPAAYIGGFLTAGWLYRMGIRPALMQASPDKLVSEIAAEIKAGGQLTQALYPVTPEQEWGDRL